MNLTEICKDIREDIVKCIASIGVGHIGGCLSLVEILAVLYFKEMNIDPQNPRMPGRDRLIVSKGHAGPAVYATLANRGYFDKSELLTLNQGGTKLPSHCDMNLTTGIDMTTGSLGQGMSCAVGAAIGSQLNKDGAYIYAIIGDGESQEGQIWEAAMFAAQKKLYNLIVFTDNNGMQIDGNTADINKVEPVDKRWESFGWNVIVVDGHDTAQIEAAIKSAKAQKEKPTMIIANTIKGKGVPFVEAKGYANHNMPFTQEDAQRAIEEIRRA
ncbi:MAG: transketolase [Clostridiales bacterium]|jgi:transketolase|nr:transketolase [Clostridiales bacterium]HOK81713.1 transketolase [Clostridia bacterium]HOL60610.1 transketolase [Clostridia bacterium]HPO53017.1 transketolase [Clostridia bacterium]